jgi:hypothetical protein
MRHQFLVILMLLGLANATPLRAQNWDATKQATGWAYQEVDGSFLFYDSGARSLRTWMKGSGLISSLPVTMPEALNVAPAAKSSAATASRILSDYDAAGALLYGIPLQQRAQAGSAKPAAQETQEKPVVKEALPERWVIDSYNRIWIVCNSRLAILGMDGTPLIIIPLPAAVEDMAVGRDGIFILYRTMKPYLEKRDLKTGALLWTFGDKNQAKEAAAQPLLVPLNRMTLGVDDTVFIAEGAGMALTVIDPAKGPKEPGQSFFTCKEAIPARAVLGGAGRGPIYSWAGKDVIFSVFTQSQVKSCGAPASQGLLLARFDIAKGTIDWVTTPLSEGHELVGLLDTEAVFLAPGGGLAYAPIR